MTMGSPMLLRRTVLTAAASALAALVTLAGADTASAQQSNLDWHGSQGAVDNSPANGVPSWAWVYAAPNTEGGWSTVSATLEIRYADDGYAYLSQDVGHSASWNLYTKVVGARVCTWRESTQGAFSYDCPSWTYVA